MKKDVVNKILTETEQGYDLIAEKFSQTRKHFWRGLEFIADYVGENERVLDFGCGNGRLLELLKQKNVQYFGADVSRKLLEIAEKKYKSVHPEFDSDSESNSDKASKRHFSKLNPSQTTLAFESEFFNAVYSIAVFHHLPSRTYREDMAKELYRVTQCEGHVVVTVWHLWQRKYLPNILTNWKNKLLGRNELDWNDCQISFTDNKGVRIQRFHHAFTKKELEKLFENAGFVTKRCEIVEGRNILYVGKKQ